MGSTRVPHEDHHKIFYDNLRCCQWSQSCHRGDFRFSVTGSRWVQPPPTHPIATFRKWKRIQGFAKSQTKTVLGSLTFNLLNTNFDRGGCRAHISHYTDCYFQNLRGRKRWHVGSGWDRSQCLWHLHLQSSTSIAPRQQIPPSQRRSDIDVNRKYLIDIWSILTRAELLFKLSYFASWCYKFFFLQRLPENASC